MKRKLSNLFSRISIWMDARLPWAMKGKLASLLLNLSGIASQFDESFYIAANLDLKDWQGTTWDHYVSFGRLEGRSPNPNFDASWYVDVNEDVRRMHLDPMLHFIAWGKKENRSPSSKQIIPALNHLSTVTPSAISIINKFSTLSLLPTQTQRKRDVLIVDLKVPTPDYDSGSMRAFEIMKILKELGFSIHFHALSLDVEPRHYTILREQVESITTGLQGLETVLTEKVFPFSDAILCRPEIMLRSLPLVKLLSPLTNVIYDTVDIHSVRLKRQSEFDKTVGLSDVIFYEKVEMYGFEYCDSVLAVSDDDRIIIESMQPEVKCSVVPNIFSKTSCGKEFAERRDIVFLGSGYHAPNRDAVSQLLAEISSSNGLNSELGSLLIVGRGYEEFTNRSQHKNVRFLGHVEDLDELLQSALALVAPLRFGSGMKGKFLSAMSNGLPVVTTKIGAEGLYLQHGLNAMISIDPRETIQVASTLVSNEFLWKQVSATGMTHIEKVCSRSEAKEALLSALQRD